MLHAALRKKIAPYKKSADLIRQPAVLLSHAFGLLNYLPFHQGLAVWLEEQGLPEAPWAELRFWPAEDPRLQPDVLIETPRYSVVVEAGVASGFSKHRLGRLWQWLGQNTEGRGYLVVLSYERYPPSGITGLCAADLNALRAGPGPDKDDVRTTTWHDLARLMRHVRGLDEGGARIRDDLVALLVLSRTAHREFDAWPWPVKIPEPADWYHRDYSAVLDAADPDREGN